jgi:hypothetical protein
MLETVLLAAGASHAAKTCGPVLIEKISDALGGLAKPWQMKRIARAEDEIADTRKSLEILGSTKGLSVLSGSEERLLHAAISRSVAEEVKKQLNIETIVRSAILLLQDTARPKDIDDDWITHFFDRSRLASNPDLQSLWARLLAGEANAPGSYSKKTLNIVSELSMRNAEEFTKLCGFASDIGPLFFDENHEIYTKAIGPVFAALLRLSECGLIFHQGFGYSLSFDLSEPIKNKITYFDKYICVNLPAGPTKFPIGNVTFTEVGRQLFKICGAQPVIGFSDFLLQQWKDFGAEML